FITEHFYKCSNEILSGLGKMYAGGGEFTENIDKMGGEGTAEFTHRAIQIYCG
nr:TipAS antibiotic-recognition domain-containing protein [Lachnospiraceae bacterium]